MTKAYTHEDAWVAVIWLHRYFSQIEFPLLFSLPSVPLSISCLWYIRKALARPLQRFMLVGLCLGAAQTHFCGWAKSSKVLGRSGRSQIQSHLTHGGAAGTGFFGLPCGLAADVSLSEWHQCPPKFPRDCAKKHTWLFSLSHLPLNIAHTPVGMLLPGSPACEALLFLPQLIRLAPSVHKATWCQVLGPWFWQRPGGHRAEGHLSWLWHNPSPTKLSLEWDICS